MRPIATCNITRDRSTYHREGCTSPTLRVFVAQMRKSKSKSKSKGKGKVSTLRGGMEKDSITVAVSHATHCTQFVFFISLLR